MNYLFTEDYSRLRVADLGIKHKRWYKEGYERFGEFLKSLPKCLEIPPCRERLPMPRLRSWPKAIAH